MSNFVICTLFALGGGTWIYSRIYSRTGGNQQHAIVVAALSGVLLFLFMLVVLEVTGNWISSAF